MRHYLVNKVRKVMITDTGLILIILAIGSILRFWNLQNIPFTHDEFSAIIRTQFTTFHDLIEKGVMVDGHPAGIQVFLYYMIKVFGVSEPILKTPFIFFGILSIWLIYLIGKNWFNSTVGLVAASFVAFLQFPVMYSQIARPYASGLCFTLMMVYFWTRIIFHPQKKYFPNLVGFIFSAALCAYNHHFSMLFAAIVWITGLFYCSRERRAWYIAAGIFIIILYLPHLPVFISQLNIGGVEGWLSKPRYDFILDYLQYIFHFSVYIYLLVFVLVSLSFYWYEVAPAVNRKFILISLVWFILPYVIGFLYSIFRSSVLQYSVLIFSFPFLLFVLFGYFKTTRLLHQAVLVLLIGIIVIPSLVFERRHYSIFYKGVYGEIVAESKKAAELFGSNGCKIILDTKKEINQYYLDKLNCPGLAFSYMDAYHGKDALLAALHASKTDYLALGCLSSTDWENYALMVSEFPYLVTHKTYFGGDFYLFSRIRPAKETSEYFYTAANTFEPSSPGWNWVDEKQCTDSLPIDGQRSFLSRQGSAFSPAYSKSLRELMHSENDVIDVSVDVRLPKGFKGAWLVLSVTSDGRDLRWESVALTDYVMPGNQGRVFLSLRLSDIEFRHHRIMFNTYIWNPNGSPYLMDNFSVRIRSGNPVIYGLFREIGND